MFVCAGAWDNLHIEPLQQQQQQTWEGAVASAAGSDGGGGGLAAAQQPLLHVDAQGNAPAYAPGTQVKLCRRCGINKPASEFYKSKANADGLDGRCKACDAIQCAERRRRKTRVLARSPVFSLDSEFLLVVCGARPRWCRLPLSIQCLHAQCCLLAGADGADEGVPALRRRKARHRLLPQQDQPRRAVQQLQGLLPVRFPRAHSSAAPARVLIFRHAERVMTLEQHGGRLQSRCQQLCHHEEGCCSSARVTESAHAKAVRCGATGTTRRRGARACRRWRSAWSRPRSASAAGSSSPPPTSTATSSWPTASTRTARRAARPRARAGALPLRGAAGRGASPRAALVRARACGGRAGACTFPRQCWNALALSRHLARHGSADARCGAAARAAMLWPGSD